MQIIENIFIEFLHIAVGKSEPGLESQLSVEQWEAIYAIAKKQSLIGVINDVIERLPDEQKPPRKYKIQFALSSERIAERNKLMDSYAAGFTRDISDMGFRSCILKGQGVAKLYPKAGIRQCGDIDIWIDADHKTAVPELKKKWKLNEVCYHHASINSLPDRVVLEVHFKPNWMNNPFKDARLQKFFAENAAEQFSNYCPEKGFAVTTSFFDCVFGMEHIFRHVLFEGVGMRQLMDYYYVLLHSSEEDRCRAYEELCALGMRKFVPAIMYVLKVFFALDDNYMLCDPDSRVGDFLVREIFKWGNFGKEDSRNHIRTARNKSARFIFRSGHFFRYLSLAPSEVLWGPYYMVWQFLWRKKYNYL